MEPGDVMWAKVAGFALWPARVAKVSEVSPAVLKAKRGTRQQLVYFFGSHDYAWVSQVQPWEENYDKNIKGSKAKAFLKALKESKQWLAARKHVFPVYQPTSDDDEEEDDGSSSDSSGEDESSSDSSSGDDDEEQPTSKVKAAAGKRKRDEGKSRNGGSNKRARENNSSSSKAQRKTIGEEHGEGGDVEGRRNAKKRRLEQRLAEQQARKDDPAAMKRRDKRHAIQRRLGLRAPTGIREITLLHRERKTRDDEKVSAAKDKPVKDAKRPKHDQTAVKKKEENGDDEEDEEEGRRGAQEKEEDEEKQGRG